MVVDWGFIILGTGGEPTGYDWIALKAESIEAVSGRIRPFPGPTRV